MISPNSLKPLSPSQYSDLLVSFLKWVEGVKPEGVYIDNKGVPTIGIGWNLRAGNLTNGNLIDFVSSANGLGITQPGIGTPLRAAWDQMIIDLGDELGKTYAKDTDRVDAHASSQETTLQNTLNSIVTTYMRTYGGRPNTYNAVFAFAGSTSSAQLSSATEFFEAQITSYDDILKGRLVSLGLMTQTQSLGTVLPTSWERVALWSMAFNNPSMIGNAMKTALSNPDGMQARMGAWFDIRYGNNPDKTGGIAKRRDAEAALFGLYKNPAAPTSGEAQALISFLESSYNGTTRLQAMLNYENSTAAGTSRKLWQYAAEYDGAEAVSFDFSTIVGAPDWQARFRDQVSFQTLFKPVASYLFDYYKDGAAGLTGSNFTFDGQVVLGLTDSTGAIAPASGLDIPNLGKNDLLIATNQNYGRIDGKDGNDVLIGAAQQDFLFGGADNDVLMGNAGNDFISGDKGNDSLYGGAGNDTYFFNKSDGADTIIDAQGEDKLYIDGQLITHANHQYGDPANVYLAFIGDAGA